MTPGPARRPRVLVIGGGVAGTTAALRAADLGADVTLLERRGHLGGLATSHDRDGWEIDNGQHVYLRCCSHYRALLARIGATELTELQPRLRIPVLLRRDADVIRTELSRSRLPLPAPLHLAPSLLRYAALRPAGRIRSALVTRALARLPADDPSVDAQALGPWLRARGESAESVTGLWELLMIGALNVPVEQASLALAAKVVATGLLGERCGGDIGRARVPLAHIHDRAARRALGESGVTVHCSTAVRRLDRPLPWRDGSWTVVADDATFAADAVVLAVPPGAAAGLAPWLAGPAEAAALGSSPIVNLHIVYDRPVMTDAFMAVVGSPVQWLFHREAPRDAVGSDYVVVSLSAADAAIASTSAQLQATFAPELARLLPAAAAARITRFVVTRERAATPRFTAGTGPARPAQATAEPGLGLAGAWTDTGWPATLEGAARSGAAAAVAALASRASDLTAGCPGEPAERRVA